MHTPQCAPDTQQLLHFLSCLLVIKLRLNSKKALKHPWQGSPLYALLASRPISQITHLLPQCQAPGTPSESVYIDSTWCLKLFSAGSYKSGSRGLLLLFRLALRGTNVSSANDKELCTLLSLTKSYTQRVFVHA